MQEEEEVSEKDQMMTVEEYVAANGLLCPYCRKGGVYAASGVEMDVGVGSQVIFCPSCQRTWTDILTLTGAVFQRGGK